MQELLSQLAVRFGALADGFPWLVVLVIYVGEKLQQRALAKGDKSQQADLIKAINDALTRAQNAAHGAVPPPVPSAPPIAPPAPQPAPAPPSAPPAPSLPYAEAPWLRGALAEIGFHETGTNQGIGKYIAMAHTGSEGDPWCAIFANAMLEQAGVTGTRSPSSQSFRTNPNFVQLSQPARGAIVVYWRISQGSGQGHVGFYWGEDAGHVWTLGGNENDMVQIEALPKSSASFGLIGYWWPKSVPLPKSGPVSMPVGTAVRIQTAPSDASAPSAASANGIQTNITATVFGGQQSAYGGPINDNAPGVALPHRFTGERPRVQVSNLKTGASVVCDIVDVGPWLTDDPYWQTGTRPEAETSPISRGPNKGMNSNKAGIDLTLAAAKAAGIDGKGLVSWSFLDSPSTPKVT